MDQNLGNRLDRLLPHDLIYAPSFHQGNVVFYRDKLVIPGISELFEFLVFSVIHTTTPEGINKLVNAGGDVVQLDSLILVLNKLGNGRHVVGGVDGHHRARAGEELFQLERVIHNRERCLRISF